MDVNFSQWMNPIGGNADNFNFSSNFTNEFGGGTANDSDAPGYSSGMSIASLLLGYPNEGSANWAAYQFWSQHYFAPWIQDDWKISHKLTLNLGLRWDFTRPGLERHNNHDGRFREEASIRSIALSSDGHQMGGMGLAIGDYNLDGHLDLVKTHFIDEATGIYSNDGKANFDDRTTQTGLNNETRYVSFGAGLVDFDNDGYPDILISTGAVHPELDRISPRYALRTPRVLFRNRGDGTFAELGAEAGPGILSRHCGRGMAFRDFDNDGDMDVLIMNVNEPPSLLRNDAPAGNHWIKIRLDGVKSNRSAIGARFIARYGRKVQTQGA